MRPLVIRFPLLLFFLAACLAPAQTPKQLAAAKPQQKAQAAVPPGTVHAQEMSPEAVTAALSVHRRILLVDVRPPAEYRAEHPEDAISAPLPHTAARLKQLQVPRQAEIVAITGSGGLPQAAVDELAQQGYTKIYYSPFEAWKKAGMKMTSSGPPRPEARPRTANRTK